MEEIATLPFYIVTKYSSPFPNFLKNTEMVHVANYTEMVTCFEEHSGIRHEISYKTNS